MRLRMPPDVCKVVVSSDSLKAIPQVDVDLIVVLYLPPVRGCPAAEEVMARDGEIGVPREEQLRFCAVSAEV